MNNELKKENLLVEEHNYEALLDSYHKLSVKDLVIKLCFDKGFITQFDIDTNSRKYVLLGQVITITQDAYRLTDSFDDENITKHNIDAYLEYKKQLAKRIIQVISDRLIAGLSDFRR